MADFPTDLSDVSDNVDDVLAKHINNIEAKIGVDSSTVTTSLDYIVNNDLTANDDTDVSGNSWVLDQDDMADDDATKVPTQQSVKAYSDSYPHKYVCKAMISSDQSVSSDTGFVTVVFNSASDPNSDFNTSTGKYACPVDGYYLVMTSITINGHGAGDRLWSIIKKDSSGAKYCRVNSPGSGQTSINNFWIGPCSSGDELYAQVRDEDDGTYTISSANSLTSIYIACLYET